MQKKPNDFWKKYGNQKGSKKHERGYTNRFTRIDPKNIKLENARPWWNTRFLVQEIPLHSR